ncbi:NADH:flavin oxidoreductase/NADH oxidase [Olavius sp. associated proteobacterium Delta 1]|nr:NADH:flavin oxidoreductase/NADH oxidase [Olavius sp. associated proteobacterium Delta 1]
MSELFDATEINGMALSNRFVRSATWEGMATEDGAPTAQLIDLMEKLAGGGVGLIISSATYVRPDGQSHRKMLGIYKDELIDKHKRMTEAVHKQDTKIVMQIHHGGFFANSKLTGQIPLAPSEVEDSVNWKLPTGRKMSTVGKEMSLEIIQDIIEAFTSAAKRAKESGFDGIQIFAGHGYLLSQFLSPAFNKRTDAYGGSLENRARIVMEVMEKVRIEVGRDYPILVKINSEDFLNEGLTLDESLGVCAMLYEGGVDAIELSGGTWVSGDLRPSRKQINSPDKEAYFKEAARALKEKVNIPLILVGGIRSFQIADLLIEEGVADYISMCRPLIREPGLIKQWKAGNLTKAACISCNKCPEPGHAGEGIYCLAERRLKEKTK